MSPSTIDELNFQEQSIKHSKIDHTKEAFMNPYDSLDELMHASKMFRTLT